MIFKYDSETFFNESVAVTNEYGAADLDNVKSPNDDNWQLKLMYHGYPSSILPSISWIQSSNPLRKMDVTGFDMVENNLQG